jgi:selenocysteine lyase/cysteine desulfurase
MSEFLGVPEFTIVFVPNATTGVNTVLRKMAWNTDGKDEILQLDVIYGACGKTTSYVCEANGDKVHTREIGFIYPVDDFEIVRAFREAIEASRKDGFRPRIAIFDTISSNPAIRLPSEKLTALCHAEGVLSLLDAAHGIGQIELNLVSLDPDFLVSNCHKWLFTARACAVFYVPERNQAMMRSTLPTSHGFITRSTETLSMEKFTDEAHQKTTFVSNFEFVGTSDNFSFLTVADAIRWRRRVRW